MDFELEDLPRHCGLKEWLPNVGILPHSYGMQLIESGRLLHVARINRKCYELDQSDYGRKLEGVFFWVTFEGENARLFRRKPMVTGFVKVKRKHRTLICYIDVSAKAYEHSDEVFASVFSQLLLTSAHEVTQYVERKRLDFDSARLMRSMHHILS